MKKLLFVFLIVSQTFWAQTAFEKANNLYQKGDYDNAIITYESILKSGQESVGVYFNLGNCFYKQNKVAPAIYNFEKALLLDPSDAEVQNNLSFAQKMTVDEIQAVPQVGFAKLLQDITASFHYDTWAWIAVGFAFVFLGCFLGYYFSSTTSLKRVFFSLMILCLLSTVISAASGFAQKNYTQNEKPAIVFAEVASVKSEPKAVSQESFVLHAGAKVYILEEMNGYYKIQLLDLKQGWIEKTAVKILKN
jgi:tetratricopeptide (TPR) repeat protein